MKAATDAKLALEPVSVYISRATQKLYVRRNTHKPAPDGGGEVFDTSIEVPVTIRNPDQPLGTHIFTAMARNDAGLRWSVVTIDNGDDAKDALDRITIPQEVLDRIAPTALPRSSIIVSDEPLSRETNYRTEFVAVLSNQPQGGFITRKPTAPPMAMASDDGWDNGGNGFGFFFQRDPNPQPVNPRRRAASTNIISRRSRCSGASGKQRGRIEARYDAPRLDHDRLNLAFDRSGPMARSDRLGDEVGRSLKLAGIPCLDLAAQRRALAERDRDIFGRRRAAHLGSRFDRDVAEACAFEIGSDDGLVVIAVRRPGHETGRVVGKHLAERDWWPHAATHCPRCGPRR